MLMDLLAQRTLESLLAARLDLELGAANCHSIKGTSILRMHMAIESDLCSSFDLGPAGTLFKGFSGKDHAADDRCLCKNRLQVIHRIVFGEVQSCHGLEAIRLHEDSGVAQT